MAKSISLGTSQHGWIKLPLADFEKRLLPGDIILGGSYIMPLAWFIRVFTGSPYTHAELYVGGYQSAGAHFQGIVVQPFVNQVKPWTYFKVLRVKDADDELRVNAAAYAITLLGEKYDFKHLFQYAWRIILGTLGKAPMNDDPKRHVCLEFVAACWHHCGVKVGGEYADNVTGKSFTQDKKLIEVF